MGDCVKKFRYLDSNLGLTGNTIQSDSTDQDD